MKRLSILLLVALFSFAIASNASAQPDIGFKGVGGKIGFVSPEDPFDSTVGLGLVADLGTIMTNIHLRGAIDYWGKSETYDGFGGSYKSTFSSLAFAANALYYFAMENSPFKPYAGGGLGLTFSKSKAEGGGYSASDSQTDLGIDLIAGADYPISPNMTAFGEFKYHSNGVDSWGIYAGVIYNLGK